MKKTLSFFPTLSFRGDQQVGTNPERDLVNTLANIRYANIELPTFQYNNCQIVSKYVLSLPNGVMECQLLTNTATDEESLNWIEVWNGKQSWESLLCIGVEMPKWINHKT